MTRRCRCVQGPRSARNEYRHPGVPGTRNKGSPASSPNSDQATIRPSGRSRLRSRTPSRTASVTIGNPDKALRLRQAKRRRRPAGGCPRFRSGEPRTGPQNTVPRRLPPRPDGALDTRPLHFTGKPTRIITQGHRPVPDRRSGSPNRCDGMVVTRICRKSAYLQLPGFYQISAVAPACELQSPALRCEAPAVGGMARSGCWSGRPRARYPHRVRRPPHACSDCPQQVEHAR